jgi:hypothetical protein
MIGMNPIMTKHNTIVTLRLDDEECGRERLAPTVSSMETTPLASISLPPMPFSVKLVFKSSLSSLPSFLNTEYDIRLTAVPLLTSILEIGLPSM